MGLDPFPIAAEHVQDRHLRAIAVLPVVIAVIGVPAEDSSRNW